VTEEILLDASDSYDGDNKPLTYLWSVKVRPTGSTATLTFANTVKARFTPDVVGSYTIQLLIISDKWSAKDELQIKATPVSPDGPVAMTLSENITVNTTLADIFEDPSQPDYIVTNNIDVHADLIIMPGVTMVFGEDKGLQIASGSIQAVGTADKGIIFKGMNTTPAYWKGILVHSSSELNKFAHVTIQQGGSSIFPEGVAKANLSLSGFQQSGAAVEMHHVTFKESGGYGLYVQEGASFSDFSNNAFSNNTAAASFIPAIDYVGV
jgi:hypothetical protein